MSATKTGREPANETWSEAVVVIYDDYESGCRAKAFLDQVAANAGGEIQFSLTLWQLDWLAYTFTANEVFHDLARSSLLVLALRTEAELPEPVVDWIACWACCQVGGHSALVILGTLNLTAEEQLRHIAERHGTRLFSQQATHSDMDWQHFIKGLPKRERTLGPILGEVRDPPRSGSYRHWGLNE